MNKTLLLIGDPVGSHSLDAIESGWKPEDITVVETSPRYAFAAQCIDERINVILDDDNLSKLNKLIDEKMKFDVIVGNPPYGSGGNIAIRFLNKCAELSDDVRLVLPLSVRKVSSLNKISQDMICVKDEQLPDETFPGGIRTVHQRWVKTDTLREKIQTLRTHPDFEFVKKEDNPDVMIFRCGASTGKLRFPGEFDDNKPDHYYIKAAPEVIYNLKAISPRLIEISTVQNGMPGISKHEFIETYIKHFGRGKIKTLRTHPDFEFVKKGDPNTNVFVMRSGYGGKVLTEGYEDYEWSHYFIHAKTPEVIENLKRCESEFREAASQTNGMDKLSKHELITIYTDKFGNNKVSKPQSSPIV